MNALLGKNVVLVAAGATHSAGLTDDGSLYTWGKGALGRLGHGVCVCVCVCVLDGDILLLFRKYGGQERAYSSGEAGGTQSGGCGLWKWRCSHACIGGQWLVSHTPSTITVFVYLCSVFVKWSLYDVFIYWCACQKVYLHGECDQKKEKRRKKANKLSNKKETASQNDFITSFWLSCGCIAAACIHFTACTAFCTALLME